MIRICTSHSITSYFRNPCSRLLYHMKKHHLCGGIPWIIMATTYAPGKTRQDWYAESLKSEEEPRARRKKNRAKPCKTHINGLVGGKNYRKPHISIMFKPWFPVDFPIQWPWLRSRAEVLLLGSCCWKPSLMGSWAVPIGLMAKGFHLHVSGWNHQEWWLVDCRIFGHEAMYTCRKLPSLVVEVV